MASSRGSQLPLKVERTDDDGVALTVKVDGAAIPLVTLDGARVRQLVERATAPAGGEPDDDDDEGN